VRYFTGSLAWLGVSDDEAFVGEPQGNGGHGPGFIVAKPAPKPLAVKMFVGSSHIASTITP
jgi:hypothetical protein